MELADDACIVYDVDDGTFEYISLNKMYRLGVDQAAVPAFCSRMTVVGVKPRAGAMWSREVCSAFREKIMRSPHFLQVEDIRGENVPAQVRSTNDGFFLDAWLAFTKQAYFSSARGAIHSYPEEGFDVLE